MASAEETAPSEAFAPLPMGRICRCQPGSPPRPDQTPYVALFAQQLREVAHAKTYA